VDKNEFWNLIDEARARVADPSDAERVVNEASARLARRPVSEIVSAAQAFWDVMADSYRVDLWGAAYLINGGCSDDGFEYFRGWLIVQGHGTHERIVADPDALADLPDIRTAAASGRYDVECESALGIADDAHLVATGDHLPPGSFTIRYPVLDFHWDFEDDVEARRRLPRLMQLYAE
jgi:Protein of unknown function (DUF4240)